MNSQPSNQWNQPHKNTHDQKPIELTRPERQELVNTVFRISFFARRKDKNTNQQNQ